MCLLAQSGHRRVLNSCPLSPDVTRTAVPRDPIQGGSTAALAAMQAVAPSLRAEVEPVNMRDAGEIESHRGFRAHSEWRTCCDAGGRTLLHRELDHHTFGPIQAARGLLHSFVTAGGRLNLLWARFC